MTYPHHLWFWIAGQEPPPDEPEKPAYQPKPDAPAPVCCPECWRSEPINPERAWAAVRAMCGATT